MRGHYEGVEGYYSNCIVHKNPKIVIGEIFRSVGSPPDRRHIGLPSTYSGLVMLITVVIGVIAASMASRSCT